MDTDAPRSQLRARDDLDAARARPRGARAHPEHQRRPARTPPTSTRARPRSPTSCATPGSTTSASCGSTAAIPYVVGEWTHRARRAHRAALRAPRRPTAGLRRPVVARSVRARVERDGRLFGRGTADDKAGVVAHVAAVRAWLRTAGELPCNVKVLVEGEEEIGSPGLAGVPRRARRRRCAPTCCSSPTPATGRSARPGSPTPCAAWPASTCGVRALDGPVHSGMAGGAVPDPVLALAQMLATLVDEHGDAAFDGCWDDYDAARRRRARPPRRAARARSTASGARGACATASSSPATRRCRSSSGSGCARRSP